MSIILRNLLKNLHQSCRQLPKFSTAVENHIPKPTIEPIISSVKYLDEDYLYMKKRQVWIENLDDVQEKKLGLMTLHPAIFAERPRVDILYQNIRWQKMYKYVSFVHTKTMNETKGGKRKPWPQKGTGRARHGNRRSPLWINGGRAHGPRSPTTHFYMLPFFSRINGLTAALSIKLAQDDLHVVKDLEIPTRETSFVQSLIEERNWGPSVLFVDTDDLMPENITLATDTMKHVNMMPVYGLNVYSMLKHNTLVLTQRAVRRIEEKILHHLHRPDERKFTKKFKLNQV